VTTRRRTTNSPAPLGPPKLTVPSPELRAQLNERIELGRQFLDPAPSSEHELKDRRSSFYSWSEFNETLLRRSFDASEPADKYRGIYVGSVGGRRSLHEEWERFREDVSTKLRRLESLREQLSLFDMPPTAAKHGAEGARAGTDVFVVHGHDTAVKASVARFLSQLLGCEPIILHEQANRGRTIIEKFEAHAASAALAVVLLTGDDEGGVVGGSTQRRARQNVILELGYFVGKLGRERVVILHETAVETPGDLVGMVYVPLDSAGAWKNVVAREVKAAGLDVYLEALVR
jgi:predicted nucleotide-binding protein